MIKQPVFISRTGTECPMALGIDINAFDNNSKIGMQVNWEGVVAVRWNRQDSPIEFKLPSGARKISAYPTPDMEVMVIITFGENFDTPNNSMILNDQAEIIFIPSLPKRLSTEKWLPKGDLYCFMQSGWCDYPDHIFFYLSIDNTDWVETRYFNYKTMAWNGEKYETWRL